MKHWYSEDWQFTLTVEKVGRANKADECRLGLEPGDTFACEYGTPPDFCPTAFIKIFPALETLRCQGDLRYLGSDKPDEIACLCPDGVVLFRLKGSHTDI